MEAVIETGGKQYSVTPGANILIDKLPGNKGDAITFDKVLFINAETPKIGAPYVSGAKVTGEILDQVKDKKIVVRKYKRRKGYHKKQGHRQLHTRVAIKEIQG